MPTVVYSSSPVYAHEFWSWERICNVSVGIVSNSMTGRQREDSSSYHSHVHGICGSSSIFPYYRTFLRLMSGKHAGHRPNYHWVGVLTVQFRCLHDFWSRQVQISANRTELSLRIRQMKQAEPPDYPVITLCVPNSPPNFIAVSTNSIQDVYEKDHCTKCKC